jgi:hypothetical protein
MRRWAKPDQSNRTSAICRQYRANLHFTQKHSQSEHEQRLLLPPETSSMSLIYLIHLNEGHHASTLDFSTRAVNAFMVLAN